MRIEFFRPRSRPANVLAEAEVHFDAMTHEGVNAVPSPFAGLKLAGFTVWRSEKDGGVFVTLPARTYEKEGLQRFFDFLRTSDPPTSEAGKSHLYRFKRWIVEAYKEWDKGDDGGER